MSWDSTERRNFVRAKFPCQITIPHSQQSLISTQAENISAGGLRVFIKEKLYTSSIVELDIYGVKKKPISCKGKIVWVFTRKMHHSKAEVLYDTGIEFHQIKDEDVEAIKKLVASIASGKKQ